MSAGSCRGGSSTSSTGDSLTQAIAKLDTEARWEATTLVAAAQHEVKVISEQAHAEVDLLTQERTELVADLKLIKNWINTR